MSAALETRMYRALWIQDGAIVAILTALRFLPVRLQPWRVLPPASPTLRASSPIPARPQNLSRRFSDSSMQVIARSRMPSHATPS